MARSGGGVAKPARILRLALARTANSMMDLALTLEDPQDRPMSLAEVLECVEERALILLLSGPTEAPGLCLISPALMSGLIEWQTLRRYSIAAPSPRAPTRTDASIISGWIDRVLAEFTTALPPGCSLAAEAPYRFGSFLPDPRPLGHLLEDVAHRVLIAGISLGGGAREGTLVFAFPAPEQLAADKGGVGGAAAADWQTTVERNVLGAETRLDAVLGRIRLTLSALVDLRVGGRVPLPMSMIDQVRLEGPDGRALATGRLGQSKGHRALKLHDPSALRTEPSAGRTTETELPDPGQAGAEKP
jgi:flagellar motor switch protein FliM